MTDSGPRRAAVVGLGLIGGSIGLRLRSLGWHVSGEDADATIERDAVEVGAIDRVGLDPHAEVTFVATPVHDVPVAAERALDGTGGVVTDVGSVKGPVVARIDNERFIGGHPMAGSEQDGLAGARSELFETAVWVLTPTDRTSDQTFTVARSVITALGADVVTIDPDRHDRLVAVVSHVPHLTAATLMSVADQRSDEHRALLRLAAGGFRDMTRVAAGRPGIWPDICLENDEAILDALDQLIDELGTVRKLVADADRQGLLEHLTSAMAARRNLPQSVAPDITVAEVRVGVFDRPGEVARITRLATDIDVNIYDLEIAHSSEGRRGVLIMLVEDRLAERLQGALMAHDYRPTIRTLD